MATYYVNGSTGNDSNTGLSGSPWATLGKAAHPTNGISNGDTVKIKPGIYYERIVIKAANSTWEHDGSAGVVYLDGKYDPVEVFGRKGINHILAEDDPEIAGWVVQNKFDAILEISANGVTVDGLTKYGIVCRNVYGQGLSLNPGYSDITVQYVHVDFTYDGSIRIFSSDSLIEHCAASRGGMMDFNPDRKTTTGNSGGGGGPAGVPSGVLFKDGDGSTARDVLCQLTRGEGLVAGRKSSHVTIEDCECNNNTHINFYVNTSRHAIIRRNLVWNDITCESRTGDAYAMGDETGNQSEQTLNQYRALNPQFYDNVAINANRGFYLRANPPPPPGEAWNYKTVVDGLYVGFNTFISNSSVGTPKPFIHIGPAQAPYRMLFENNIIEVVPGSGVTSTVWKNEMAASKGTVGVRNNIWRTQPEANARGTDDQYGNPNLVNSSWTAPALNYVRNAPTWTPVSIRDTATFYQLKPNAALAIDKASDDSDTDTNTPPTITTDFDGATRGSLRDIGAWEFDGTPTDPEETLTANFTQSATAGFAPLTVNFTDTSVSSGTKTAWLWTLAPGITSTTQNTSYIYNTPGTYTPTLKVTDSNGLTKTKTGTPIVVGTSGGGGDEELTSGFDVVRRTVPTSLTTFDVDLDLNGRDPVAAMFILSNVTAVGTPVAGAMLSKGFWAGGQGYSGAICSKDNAAAAEPVRVAKDDTVIISLNEAGITGEAKVVSVGPDVIHMQVTDAFPAAYQLTVIAFAGSEAEAQVVKRRAGNAGTTFTAPGGDIALAFSTWLNALGAVTNDLEIAFGAATDTASAAALWHDKYGADPTQVQSSVTDAFLLRDRTGVDTRANVRADSVSAGQYAVTNRNSGHDLILMPMRFDGQVKVGQIVAETTTDPLAYDFGFQPALVLLWGGLIDSNDTQGLNNNLGSAFWEAAVTPDGTFYTGITAEDAAATSNTQSNVDNSLKVYKGGNTLDLVGAVTIEATGIEIDWTTVTGREVIINYAAFEGGAEIVEAQAIPDFIATPLEVGVGETVTITDLTNPNGATILSVSLDFGDDTIPATTANTTHVYDEPRTYTLTLTVTTDAGEVQKIRENYINVVYVPDTVVIRRASIPLTTTNLTPTILHDDLNDEENFGTHSHAYDADGMQVQIDPADREVPGGEFWIYAVSEEDGDITLLGKDGSGNTYTGPTFTKD